MTQGPRIDPTDGVRFARDTTQNVLVRFGTREERDRWVEFGDLHREPVDPDDHVVHAARLRAARNPDTWFSGHDPHADATYEWMPAPTPPIPWSRLRDRYDADLGLGETLAWWLVEDPDGPGHSQKRAAELLGIAYGSLRKQLSRVRGKLGDERRNSD
jgi:hypothetical protein